MPLIQLDTTEIIKLYNSGLSCKEIGQELGASSGTIKNRLEKAGIPRRRGKSTDIPIGSKFGDWTTVSSRYRIGKDAYVDAECGCGTIKPVSAANLNNGRAKSCASCSLKGDRSPNWNGGKTFDVKGYVKIYTPGHPKAKYKRNRYVYEHVLVMEKVLGRYLLSGENVHHKNGVKSDNRPENLELWSTAQPNGQRVEDKTAWAVDWLRDYAPQYLKDDNESGTEILGSWSA